MNLNQTWTSKMVLKWTRTKPEPLKYFEQELNLNPNRYLKRFDTLVVITSEMPVTILQAYICLPRHIRKGMLIRRIIASHLCTAFGCQLFHIESRKRQRRIMLNVIITFTIIVCCLALRDVPKTVLWVNQNEGRARAADRGAWPPCPP